MQQAYEEAFFAELQAHNGIDAENEHTGAPDSDKDHAAEPSKAEQVDGHPGNNPQPLPVLHLLTLYGLCCGGVAEDRLDVLFDLYADTAPALRYATPQELGRNAALELLGLATPVASSERVAADASDAPDGDQVAGTAAEEAISRTQLLQLIAGARDTFQLPARQCVSEITRYPTPQWRRKSANDHLRDAAADRKLPLDGNPSVGVFDRDTVEDLLFAKGVCIWAECYNEVR
jgi:hypothetical protein